MVTFQNYSGYSEWNFAKHYALKNLLKCSYLKFFGSNSLRSK